MKIGLSEKKGFYEYIKSPFLGSGFFLYLSSFFIWLYVLKNNELSFAFPIASSTLFICIALLSTLVLKEPLSAGRLIGMAVIAIGIFIISRG